MCSLPELYGWYERIVGVRDSFDAIYDGWRFALFIVWFLVLATQTLAQCFADKRGLEYEKNSKDFKSSPELDSSYLNRLFLWWFNYVPIM